MSMIAMNNVYFVLEEPQRQVFAITDVGADQSRWLDILSRRISGSAIFGSRPCDGIHFGLFTYMRFRNFLREAGYAEAVSRADTLYRCE